MKSAKEVNVDINLIDLIDGLRFSGKVMDTLKLILADDEIQSVQEYANTVSIIRLGFNDHGPVHMRIVTHNAIVMLELLRKAGIRTTIETDRRGNFEDSIMAVMFAANLHDIGMCMGRQNHELHGTIIAQPIIDRILKKVFEDDIRKIVTIRSIAMEGIAGHMGTINISSLEAGIVQVADGCDMTKGRARIPIAMNQPPRVGHIHQYSANSIEKVDIVAGEEKPIRIEIHMSNEIGLFQVEEVLMHKISKSTAKQFIELYARVGEEKSKQYL